MKGAEMIERFTLAHSQRGMRGLRGAVTGVFCARLRPRHSFPNEFQMALKGGGASDFIGWRIGTEGAGRRSALGSAQNEPLH